VVDLPKISVILCTHNRAHTLTTALESIAAQSISESVGWDVVVVDNNSSDETRQVVEDFKRRYPDRFRYFFEKQQGISHARNRGIQEAHGEILAFIDDDETAAPNWLQNLTANLHNGEWSGAGGRILPQWNCDRPRWLSDKSRLTLAPLAVFDLGTKEGPLTESPFGANMAFRKEVFNACGGFRTDLGRVGKGMLSGEDSELGRRVFAAGRRLRYEPSALTYHPVEEYRVSRKYFLQWWFNKGRTDVREFGNRSKDLHLLGIPLRLARALVMESLRWMFAFESTERFICKLKVWACAGQVSEYFHQSLEGESDKTERSAKLAPPANDGR
jgi:glycosyltransferase involved in cell wall biosynthesis